MIFGSLLDNFSLTIFILNITSGWLKVTGLNFITIDFEKHKKSRY